MKTKYGNRIGSERVSWRDRKGLKAALDFYSMFGSLESLLILEQKHEMSRPSV